MSPLLQDSLQQALETVFMILLAPLVLGWVNQCRAWLQNRRGPGLLQPYRVLRKLFNKEPVLAHRASLLFRRAPYIQLGCIVLAASIVPSIATGAPLSPAADVIALVGLLALARVFLALAAMDVGTAFGSMGARREMLIAGLAEPALLMVFFTPALISGSTAFGVIVDRLALAEFQIYPGLAFAAVAFLMVLLAENARIPIDNPSTHLELTMIHEAMILEYSGRHLAVIEWAHALKLTVYLCIGIALFVPWGIAPAGHWSVMPLATLILVGKLFAGGAAIAVLETLSAKLRIFRAPEFLGTAFLLAVLAMLIHFLLGT